MGKCTFCGNKAGWLADCHPECQKKHSDGCELVASHAENDVLLGLIDFEELKPMLQYYKREHFLTDNDVRRCLIAGAEKALNDLPSREFFLTSDEEKAALKFLAGSGLSTEDLNRNGAWNNLVKSAILRDLNDGIIPARFSAGLLPVNLGPGERVLWAYSQIQYAEDRVVRDWSGVSSGVSVPLGGGVRARIGGFQAAPSGTQALQLVDTGMLVVTDRNLIFSGQHNAFKIHFASIVSFNPARDGLGVCAGSRQQVFITGDGWFIYPVVYTLAQMSLAGR